MKYFNTNGDFEFINAINLWIDVGLFLTYYLKVFNVWISENHL